MFTRLDHPQKPKSSQPVQTIRSRWLTDSHPSRSSILAVRRHKYLISAVVRRPCFLTYYLAVQTDIRAAVEDPSADDFLAREKALLGDDADLFTTTQDAAAVSGDVGGDLLGGEDNAQSTFESQFPDITTVQQVRPLAATRA